VAIEIFQGLIMNNYRFYAFVKIYGFTHGIAFKDILSHLEERWQPCIFTVLILAVLPFISDLKFIGVLIIRI
jgi:hypothetical protein